jgi:hypothetical protein
MKRPSIPVTMAILAATACSDSSTTTAPAEGVLFATMAAPTYDCTAQEQIPETECLALVALYDSTDGPNWTNHSGWLEGTSQPCDWDNVGCWDGSVTNLELNANNLSGSIPPELGALSNLGYLGLGDNQLSGPIPPQLGNLSNLWGIHLYNNQLSGPIPAELGNLSNLEGLQAIGNQLSGSIPAELGNLTKLKRLNLADNQLSGEIPAALGNLSNLEALHLHSNQLSGAIPLELGNLAKLGELELCENQLTGSIPVVLGNLTDLYDLLLCQNQLSGPIPAELGNLTKLVRLELHDNELTGPIPGSFGNLTLLESLWLADNHLGGLVPLEVAILGGSPPTSGHCAFVSGNDGLYMPDIKPYRDADLDNDGYICELGFSSILPVAIDLKPGGYPNSINLRAAGRISVAVLTTEHFDATTVAPVTVTLGDNYGYDTGVATRRNGSLVSSLEDVDGDGDLDLVLQFELEALVANGDITENTTLLILNGGTMAGGPIRGEDTVRIVP